MSNPVDKILYAVYNYLGNDFMNDINIKIIYEEDICSLLLDKNPKLSATALKWELYHYVKNNSLFKIGEKKYAEGLKFYDYDYQSSLAFSIDRFLYSNFKEVKIVIFETTQLNEWLNFLLNTNVIYVEVEKEYVDYVFSSLNDKFGNKNLILLNPDENTISRYLRDDLVIVKTLFSKSPINKTNRKIKLEKLVVDVLAKDISLDTRSIEDIIFGIKKTYGIDINRTISYASRRRLKEKFIELWEKDNA